MRSAGRDLLSLALLDARNHLLMRLARFDAPGLPAATRAQAWHSALRGAAYQERWVLYGGHGGQAGQRGAEPEGEPAAAAARNAARDPDAARAWMAQTLEASLDRLASTPDEPAALAFFHQALLHEDRLGEHCCVLLQEAAPPARSQRAALWLPAQCWSLGSAAHPAVPFNEWGHDTLQVPEFEIDAQPVNWQQYAEFATDGGYDRAELWSAAGWAWLQGQAEVQAAGHDEAGARRAPRHVAQLTGGVLVQRRHGAGVSLQRAASGQAAMHVSRFEAEAWCRWAGRRLPTEPEWDLAASAAASRGFAWGDVFEWVAGSARAWPGAGPAPAGCLDALPPAVSQGVLRGASFATPRRRHHASARRFAPPGHDHAFCGFRSCAS